MARIIGFDLETAKLLDIEAGLGGQLPMGITCAVVHAKEDETVVWKPPIGFSKPARLDRALPKSRCIQMAEWLCEASFNGDVIATINGAGFDFRVLWGEIEGAFPVKPFAEMVMRHVDLGFTMLCQLGYMAGLNAMGNGMGLGGKMEGLGGVLAVEKWNTDIDTQREIIDYCARDAQLTGQVARAVVEKKRIVWITKAGAARDMPLEKLLTVEESLTLPLPDTSWMTAPRKREDYVGWLDALGEVE